jgi:hypothetical protein
MKLAVFEQPAGIVRKTVLHLMRGSTQRVDLVIVEKICCASQGTLREVLAVMPDEGPAENR